MDLSVTSTIAAYLPQQAATQSAGMRANGSTGGPPASAATAGDGRRGQGTADSALLTLPDDRGVRERAVRPAADAVNELARNPGFQFEYEDRRQVMKVHNARGVLIYQVPSKGQLALIQAEEAAAQRSEQLSLTA